MSDIDPKKLKVTELREELKSRGLDAKGNKAQLVKRLAKALANESGVSEADESSENLDSSQLDTSHAESDTPAQNLTSPVTAELEPTPVPELQTESEPVVEPVIESEVKQEAVTEPAVEVEPEPVSQPEEPVVQHEMKEEPPTTEPEIQPEPEPTSQQSHPEDTVKDEGKQEVVPDVDDEQVADHEAVPSEIKQEPVVQESMPAEAGAVQEPVTGEAAPAADDQAAEKPKKTEGLDENTAAATVAAEHSQTEVKAETDDAPEEKMETSDGDADPNNEGIDLSQEEFQVMDQVGGDDEVKKEDDKERRAHKRRHSEERKRSHSRDRYHRHRSHSPQSDQMDSEAWLSSTDVQIDRFNSDLNLRVSTEGFRANPITVEGFAYMWAGCRSNYGVTKGKVAYEAKVTDELNVNHLPSEETSRHVVRFGYSTDSTSLQLGEESFSYGYGGTAKASTDCKFKDFGAKFGVGDVIGAYLDFESDPVTISYTKNGEDQGVCFEIERASLGDEALFPHILSKNCEFEVNFGQMEEPFYPIKEGFAWIGNVPAEDRVRGSLPPAKKEDCEMIMMCGLPGAGKTYWAIKHQAAHPEKKFNILGTNSIIDKMKVMGLPRKKNYAGRWDVLIDKSTKCLNRLFEIAAKKKRNYVLDQTNVYPSAQRRKMRPFEGFQRKAVVIVPTDEEFKNRIAKREKEEGKDVPDHAVLEMKANFALPVEGSPFDAVEFVELDKQEATKLVEQYNKEGKAAGPPPDKRQRFNYNQRYDNRSGDRNSRGRDYRGYDNRSDHRGGGYRDDRRGGYRGGRDYGNDRYGGGRGGGHDRNHKSRGNYMGYSDRDRQRVQSYPSDYRDRRHDGNRYGSSGSSHHSSSSSGSWNNQKSWSGYQGGQSGQWGSQGWGQNQAQWGSNQGQWGQQQPQQQQGSWGQQGWGQQGWNQYNQGQQQGSWGQQNYNYNYNYSQYPQQQQQQQQTSTSGSSSSTDTYNQWYYQQQSGTSGSK